MPPPGFRCTPPERARRAETQAEQGGAARRHPAPALRRGRRHARISSPGAGAVPARSKAAGRGQGQTAGRGPASVGLAGELRAAEGRLRRRQLRRELPQLLSFLALERDVRGRARSGARRLYASPSGGALLRVHRHRLGQHRQRLPVQPFAESTSASADGRRAGQAEQVAVRLLGLDRPAVRRCVARSKAATSRGAPAGRSSPTPRRAPGVAELLVGALRGERAVEAIDSASDSRPGRAGTWSGIRAKR